MMNLIRIVNHINTELENRAVSLGIDQSEIDIPTLTIETDGDYILFKFCSIAIFGVENVQDIHETQIDELENVLRKQVSELCTIIGSLGMVTH